MRLTRGQNSGAIFDTFIYLQCLSEHGVKVFVGLDTSSGEIMPDTNFVQSAQEGAAGLEKLGRDYFPGAVQIVDFYHALEHLQTLIETIWGKGDEVGNKRRRRHFKKLLAHDGVIASSSRPLTRKNHRGATHLANHLAARAIGFPHQITADMPRSAADSRKRKETASSRGGVESNRKRTTSPQSKQ